MKIERISENQIKCTLSRSDLASHQVKISELAYGSEKTKDLFQDMMDQAFEECGFDANDIPLMIEAIPVSMDCIILMITKVEDPEEIDTDFSGLSNWEPAFPDEDPENVPDFSQVTGLSKNPVSALPEALERIYCFESIDSVIELAHCVGETFNGGSSLYRSRETEEYYLIITNAGVSVGEFGRVCNAALEYGSKDPMGFARSAHIKEQFKSIIKCRALQKLATV